MNTDILNSSGINYDNGVRRFKGNARIYERLLSRFLEDGSLERAQLSYKNGDMAKFADDVHEIKGVAGNLDMTGLYVNASSLMSLLRSGEDDAAAIDELFLKICADYERAKDGIKNAID